MTTPWLTVGSARNGCRRSRRIPSRGALFFAALFVSLLLLGVLVSAENTSQIPESRPKKLLQQGSSGHRLLRITM